MCQLHVNPSITTPYICILGGIERYRRTFLTDWVIGSEKGAENSALCCNAAGFRGFLVCDFIDQAGQSVIELMAYLLERHQSDATPDLRLEPDDIAHKLALVPLLITHLACPIDHLDALHPFVHGELDFASKVVQMPCQAGHDFTHPRRRLGSHGVDHILSELRVEPMRRLFVVGRHAAGWVVDGEMDNLLKECLQEDRLMMDTVYSCSCSYSTGQVIKRSTDLKGNAA